MSVTDPVYLYPQPIPVVGGYAIAHRPGKPFEVLLVRPIDERETGDWILPGSIYSHAQHANPLEAAVKKLGPKTGCEPIGTLQPFLADLRRGINYGSYCGYNTDQCLNLVVAGPVRGNPAPNRDLYTKEARFFDVTEIERMKLGRGHKDIIDQWTNAVARQDTATFRFIRHGKSRIRAPRKLRRSTASASLQTQYPEPIPIITSTWIAHEYDNPYRVLFISKRNDAAPLKYLPGGIFDWGPHDDLLETGTAELDEESGLSAVGDPFPLFLDFRKGRDSRVWCSKRTDHCIDLIVACPVRGKLRPKDKAEVKQAGFFDIREINPRLLGYGHATTVDRWIQAIATSGALKFDFIL